MPISVRISKEFPAPRLLSGQVTLGFSQKCPDFYMAVLKIFENYVRIGTRVASVLPGVLLFQPGLAGTYLSFGQSTLSDRSVNLPKLHSPKGPILSDSRLVCSRTIPFQLFAGSQCLRIRFCASLSHRTIPQMWSINLNCMY